MSFKTRIHALEEKLAPMLARQGKPLSVKELSDAELEFLIHQQHPDIDLNDDQALLQIIAGDSETKEQ